MSSHFNPKSLAFYAIAIGSVVVLFSVTTAYGESHLRAPKAIDGRYPLSASALPGCLTSQNPVLLIQQSGVYVTGSLVTANADERTVKVAEERPSLKGNWNDDVLTLSGPLNHLNACQDTVQIQGTVNNHNLNGKLRLGSTPNEVEITAQQEEPKPKAQGH
jgi:hypothetical protein